MNQTITQTRTLAGARQKQADARRKAQGLPPNPTYGYWQYQVIGAFHEMGVSPAKAAADLEEYSRWWWAQYKAGVMAFQAAGQAVAARNLA